MTPEAIHTLTELREAFYALFEAEMNVPISIKKGNSWIINSSFAFVACWEDDRHRHNYISVYAYTTPDALIPKRPFILRLSINQWNGTSEMTVRRKTSLKLNRDWEFQLTVLPEELLSFVPWVVSWIRSQDNGVAVKQPPHRLKFMPSKVGIGNLAWTEGACQCIEQQYSGFCRGNLKRQPVSNKHFRHLNPCSV